MINQEIKILFVDDVFMYEHIRESIVDILDEDFNITVLRYTTNATEALEFLDDNTLHFDAVVLDGLFLYRKDSCQTNNSIPLFLMLNAVKDKLPFYIFTGQLTVDDLENGIYDMIDNDKSKVFLKTGNNEGLQKLGQRIRNDFDNNLPYFNKKYSKFLSIVGEGVLLNTSYKEVLEFIHDIEIGHSKSSNEINGYRKIIEGLFDKLVDFGYLPMNHIGSNVGNSAVNLRRNFLKHASSEKGFLDKNPNGYSYFYKEEHKISLLILNVLDSFIDFVNDLSHNKIEIKNQVNEFEGKEITLFLKQKLFSELVMIVEYFDMKIKQAGPEERERFIKVYKQKV